MGKNCRQFGREDKNKKHGPTKIGLSNATNGFGIIEYYFKIAKWTHECNLVANEVQFGRSAKNMQRLFATRGENPFIL